MTTDLGDDGGWVNVTADSYAATRLADGEHSIEVLAFDIAGNIGDASATFLIEKGSPELSITCPVSYNYTHARASTRFGKAVPLGHPRILGQRR